MGGLRLTNDGHCVWHVPLYLSVCSGMSILVMMTWLFCVYLQTFVVSFKHDMGSLACVYKMTWFVVKFSLGYMANKMRIFNGRRIPCDIVRQQLGGEGV